MTQQMGARSAFFQSAKGNFASRAGLVYNMGFDKFWARDDLGDPNLFIGYLACDEFAMLGLLVRPLRVMAVFALLVVANVGLFQKLPKSFLPEEDQGYFIVIAQLPDGASKQRTVAVLERIERFFQAIPAVHSTDALTGQNFVFGTRGPNSATMFVPLVLWDERPEPQYHAKALVGAAYAEFAKIPEALLLAFNAPSIRGVGAVGGFSAQIQDPSSGDFKKFAMVAQQFVESAQKEPAIGRVGTNFRVSSPRLYANVNRERAKALGVPISDIFDTLQAYFGNFYINDFIKSGRVYHVQTEADAKISTALVLRLKLMSGS